MCDGEVAMLRLSGARGKHYAEHKKSGHARNDNGFADALPVRRLEHHAGKVLVVGTPAYLLQTLTFASVSFVSSASTASIDFL